jgi:hypothetical protein
MSRSSIAISPVTRGLAEEHSPPAWLQEKLKAGAKLEDFAVDKPRYKGTKKRRRAKR